MYKIRSPELDNLAVFVLDDLVAPNDVTETEANLKRRSKQSSERENTPDSLQTRQEEHPPAVCIEASQHNSRVENCFSTTAED
eukprot:4029721-Pleurochrysis_carterae.AAC.1